MNILQCCDIPQHPISQFRWHHLVNTVCADGKLLGLMQVQWWQYSGPVYIPDWHFFVLNAIETLFRKCEHGCSTTSQSSKVPNSMWCENEGLQQVVQQVHGWGFTIGVTFTHCHSQNMKRMQENLCAVYGTKHYIDCWHVHKGMGCKPRNCHSIKLKL